MALITFVPVKESWSLLSLSPKKLKSISKAEEDTYWKYFFTRFVISASPAVRFNKTQEQWQSGKVITRSTPPLCL